MTTIGRYKIRRKIGRSDTATVYLAFDPRSGRQVAIKVLPRELLHDSTHRARFEREAKLIAELEDPAIVPVYDFGEEDGQPYLVMRYMAGGSLSDRLQGGPLSLGEATALIERLAAALDKGHRCGVLHGDIKPSNILFDREGNPCIADFGITNLLECSAFFTSTGIIGTPTYMSPEQIEGDLVLDGRSDVYSLGVVLYEILAGKPPYQADTPTSVALTHVHEPVPQVRQAVPSLPEAVERVVTTALAKDRAQRYPTADALAAALKQAAESVLQSARLVPPVREEQPQPAMSPAPGVPPQRSPREPAHLLRWIALFLVVVVCLVAVNSILIVLLMRDDSPVAEPVPLVIGPKTATVRSTDLPVLETVATLSLPTVTPSPPNETPPIASNANPVPTSPTSIPPADLLEPTADGAVPLAPSEVAQSIGATNQPPDMAIDVDVIYLATIRTSKGEVVLELYGQEAPIAVNNFVTLSQLGFYDNAPLNPSGSPRAVLIDGPTILNQANPGYDVRAEIGIRNLTSTIGYLRFPDPANPERLSNSSRLYITLEPVPDIDGVYAAFGQVIKGQEVLEQIEVGDVIGTIIISEAEERVAPTPAPPAPTLAPDAPASAEGRPLAAINPAQRDGYFNTAPKMQLEEGVDYVARITTDVGEIVVDLFEEQTPLTVNNFVTLANLGFYDNTVFHRVIEGYVAQAGDPSGTGRGGPGYMFEDEIVPELVFDKAGLLAMANAGPGTNGSQFFITFGAADWLNGQHTIFGQIIQGQDVLEQIQLRDPAEPSAPATVIESITIETK